MEQTLQLYPGQNHPILPGSFQSPITWKTQSQLKQLYSEASSIDRSSERNEPIGIGIAFNMMKSTRSEPHSGHLKFNFEHQRLFLDLF